MRRDPSLGSALFFAHALHGAEVNITARHTLQWRLAKQLCAETL